MNAVDHIDNFLFELREERPTACDNLDEIERILRQLSRSDNPTDIEASDALRARVFQPDRPLNERLLAWKKISLDLLDSLGLEH
jgi:hypothetical protein